jgi:cytidine deaminase
MLTREEIAQLITHAQEVRANAFVPKSQHAIGACVLTTDGNYYPGCNVENSIAGLGVCAERAAIDHAVIHGKYEFKAVAVVDEVAEYPCGACLQYLEIFAQIIRSDVPIFIADIKGEYSITSLQELLPHAYKTGRKFNFQPEILTHYRNK